MDGPAMRTARTLPMTMPMTPRVAVCGEDEHVGRAFSSDATVAWPWGRFPHEPVVALPLTAARTPRRRTGWEARTAGATPTATRQPCSGRYPAHQAQKRRGPPLRAASPNI